jgi:hypothetical protein
MELYHDISYIAFSIVIVLKPLMLSSTGISQFLCLLFRDNVTSVGRLKNTSFTQSALVGTTHLFVRRRDVLSGYKKVMLIKDNTGLSC